MLYFEMPFRLIEAVLSVYIGVSTNWQWEALREQIISILSLSFRNGHVLMLAPNTLRRRPSRKTLEGNVDQSLFIAKCLKLQTWS